MRCGVAVSHSVARIDQHETGDLFRASHRDRAHDEAAEGVADEDVPLMRSKVVEQGAVVVDDAIERPGARSRIDRRCRARRRVT